MDIRKLSLRSLVFAAAAAVPVATASAAMACVPPPVGHGTTAALTAYHHPQPAPAKCKPFSPKNRFFYGPNKPGQDWCITWCAPKETGRWVQKGPKKWEWVVTVDKGKHPVPVCKPVVKTPPPKKRGFPPVKPGPRPTWTHTRPAPRPTWTHTRPAPRPTWTRTWPAPRPTRKHKG
jgi:hypothetical protein